MHITPAAKAGLQCVVCARNLSLQLLNSLYSCDRKVIVIIVDA